MEDIKVWVLQKILEEREITRKEIELSCEKRIREFCAGREISKTKENYSWVRDMMAPSADWMYICRKEMQKMREEWIKEDKLRITLENNSERKEEEKQKKDEKRRLDEQMAESITNIKRGVSELEDSRERIAKERAKEKEKMEECLKMLKADMEKEKEKMREYMKRIKREREIEKEDLKEYVVIIQEERQKEKEDIMEHIKRLKESQRALEEERKLSKEEMKNIEREWMKEKKWMAQCIEEEETEKLEMKRAMWWMRTERNQEKHQLKVYQQRDELRMREMEQLRKEVNEKLDAQREKLKNEFKDREMRMQMWEEKQEMISHDQQRGWMTARLELQKEKRNRAKSEWKTNQLAREIYIQSVELEDKFLTIARDLGREIKVKNESKLGFFRCLKM
ncbi:hypothetical protein Baya_6031 [Bagarius yarrelli]|uniref:Uncharacterized protein n=1 Tax=Bagarius yarrelli TaxID=175774 RepID=A0A556U0V2_BAGYA|nr:hypothetical protein Baya_6031 [Bagarius yarrelli]